MLQWREFKREKSLRISKSDKSLSKRIQNRLDPEILSPTFLLATLKERITKSNMLKLATRNNRRKGSSLAPKRLQN